MLCIIIDSKSIWRVMFLENCTVRRVVHVFKLHFNSPHCSQWYAPLLPNNNYKHYYASNKHQLKKINKHPCQINAAHSFFIRNQGRYKKMWQRLLFFAWYFSFFFAKKKSALENFFFSSMHCALKFQHIFYSWKNNFDGINFAKTNTFGMKFCKG